MTTRPVSNEQVAAYKHMLHSLARPLDGLQGAEYDDLFQEGWEHVFLTLQRGLPVSKEIIRRKMLNWVNKCARHGLGGYENDKETNDLLS